MIRMQQFSRRGFLFGAAAMAAAATGATRIRMCLSTGMIGVQADLRQSIAWAAKFGFQAVDPNPKELAALSDAAMQAMLDDLASRGLTFGSVAMGFPVGQSDEAWATFVEELTATAKTLRRARMDRLVTWISSSDPKLTYLENFRLHVRRLGQAADILDAAGIRLGLEYLGPKTLWARSKYPFIHNMATMKELIAAMGKPNVGFLMDIWHWYTSGDTVEDVLSLKNHDVVAVHLNDAPRGIPVDEQIDNHRELPMTTGIINMSGFLNALNRIGYDGPAAAEPFSAALRTMPPEEAVAKTAEAMKKAFALIQ